jgi:hypothetical protein
MKRAIFIVLLLLLGHTSFSQNLVVNPGFETWGTTTKPTDWTTAQGCQKDEINIKSGIFSCHQEGSSASKDLGQKFNINSLKQYRFSFFYKTGTATTGNGCRVWCEWLDDNQAPINDPVSESVLHSGYMKSESWKQFSVDLTPPAGAGYFNLLVRSLPNSITYWDDFEFTEGVPTKNYEEKLPEIIIYPSPARDYLNINNMQTVRHIDILYITGTSIWSSDFSGEESVSIPVSGLSNGLYIIRIRTSEKIIIRKFIKK